MLRRTQQAQQTGMPAPPPMMGMNQPQQPPMPPPQAMMDTRQVPMPPPMPMPQQRPPQALPRATGGAQGPGVPGGAPGAPTGPDAPTSLDAEIERQQQRVVANAAAQKEAWAPPDRSGLAAYGQRRAGEGRRALNLALAAQEAGKDMAPLAKHFMQQSSAAQTPEKVGGGIIDAEGNFVEDPSHMQDMKIKSLQAEQSQIESILQKNLSAKERAHWEQARLDSLVAQKAATAATAAEGRASRLEQGNWRVADGMSRQFDAQVKSLTEELYATQKMAGIAPGRRPNAIEQQGLAILLQKFQDPDSVVREAEYARAGQAAGLVDRATNIYAQVMRGEILPDSSVRDIRAMSQMFEEASKQKLQRLGDLYSDKSRRRGLNPEDVVVNQFYKHGGGGGGGGGLPPGVTVTREK
jgi:hypothetical protein